MMRCSRVSIEQTRHEPALESFLLQLFRKKLRTQRKGVTEIQNWSARKWKEEIQSLAWKMWLGDKLARTVGILSIDSFDENEIPAKLATAAATLKFLKYKANEEMN